jgi:soluble lytic murein transglycosylase-like protein
MVPPSVSFAQIKKKNPAVFNWLVEHQLDLENIGKFTSGIATAIALAVATTPQVNDVQAAQTATVQAPILTREELKGKTDIERAALVWSRYGHLIRRSATEYDLDPNLIFATIMVESGGNTYAIRQEPRIHDASYGLGQLLYGTARSLGYRGTPEGLYDPAVNIDLIARYHARNFARYQDLSAEELTIAYNTGSPYKRAIPGHLTKFNKWYNSLANLEVDLT